MSAAPPVLTEIHRTLLEHFSAANTPDKWDELWKDKFSPWDRGLPNPALVDLLVSGKDLSGTPVFDEGSSEEAAGQDAGGQGTKKPNKKKKTALVPGCGRGYDVLLLAACGYDAVGLDASTTAIEACQELASGEPGEAYPLKEGVSERGSVRFVAADFYANEWENEEKFDLIYDYTFMVALPPSTRKDWALRMSQLLSPTGRLVCLEFPLYKDPAAGGPPFAVRQETYEQHLARPGEDLEYKDGLVVPIPDVKPNANGLKCVSRWKPTRTHAVGEGWDHISVWAHASS